MSPTVFCRAARDRDRAAHDAVDTLSLHRHGFSGTATRLHELIEEASQDYALAALPSVEAIRAFGRALQAMRGAGAPWITLTPSGAIWAEWSELTSRSVALIIQNDGSARLGAVLQVSDCTCRPLHLDVEGDADAVVERLRTDRDLRWIVEGATPSRSP